MHRPRSDVMVPSNLSRNAGWHAVGSTRFACHVRQPQGGEKKRPSLQDESALEKDDYQKLLDEGVATESRLLWSEIGILAFITLLIAAYLILSR